MFQGSIVALVTPMTSNGELDEEKIRTFIEFHIEQGTDAICVNGTTGEAPTLTKAERERLIKITVETVAKRVPVIAGTGTYNTAETVEETREAKKLGVDGCLIVTPYYNRPIQEGLFQHYQEIAKSVSIPIIMYNVPVRTGCDLLPETVLRLSKISNIIGLKESTGSLERSKKILEICGDSIDLFTGEDANSLAFILQGGKGAISVTANVAPKMMHDMCRAALNKDIAKAGTLNAKLMPLHKKLFLETNPIPVKWALHKLGLIQDGIRLPLTKLSPDHHESLKEAMIESGVLN